MKKFFISSTFQDMHAERDMIQNIVQPAVNQKLNEQGEYVLFSDLRWGIDTMTDSTERRILDSCFDEIDSCKPYFVVFIGGRYGWIPSDDLVIPYKDRFGDVDILDKSVTELEVLYALKMNANELGRCLFYFKDDVEYENKDTKTRIEELKHKIERVAQSQVRHYNALTNKEMEEALSNQLITDICGILSIDKPLNWQERIANQMKVKYETALPGITSQWLDGLKSESVDLAVLLFPECRVKESFIINFSSQIKNSSNKGFLNRLFSRGNKKESAIYINVGATKDISETYDLQKYLIFQICEICKTNVPPIENLSDVKLRSLMSNLLTDHVKSGGELYIIISEYDKLIDAQNTKWLPDYIKNVKWVISLSNQSIAESLPSSTHKKSIYGASHLSDISFDKQIAAYEDWSGKTVTPQVKEALKALPYADEYMMLEVIFNRFMHFDGKDIPSGDTKDLPQYMEQYIKNVPYGNGNNIEAILYFLKGDFEKFNLELCEFIFICMSFFNRGLMISDIEKIAQLIGIPWTELDIIRFLNYESFLLTQYEDGRYDISSSVISNSLAKLYHQKFRFDYSNPIYDYLNGLPNEASIKIDNFWFLCYMSNHFREYLDYLKALYEVRKDNTDLKAAFLPLFFNTEAVRWMFTSFKKGNLKYDSTDFIAELVSIIAQTFSAYSPQFVDEFIVATQIVGDMSGDLKTIFRQHYTLALDKIKNLDYKGFIEEFETCLKLSEKQFKENPPKLNFFDDEHKFFMGSFQDMLDNEYGFSFVQDMVALMSKYADLPKEYQDETKASYYADKANEIRARISEVSYVLPKDVWEINKGNTESVKRKEPSLLRGKAVELSKQADRTENIDSKIILLKESLGILDEILAIPEDDLVGEYKDSEKTIEYETTIYEECFRDRALVFSHLASILEDEKFDYLNKAFYDILVYKKGHNNEQVKRDVLNIVQPLATVSLEKGHDDLCLDCCVKAYEAFAEIKPKICFMFFDINVDDYIYKITIKNASLQDLWISECKRMINTFQSRGEFQSMYIIIKALYESLKQYVLEENIERHADMFMWLMESMSCQLKEMMNEEYFLNIYNDASILLERESIRGEKSLSILNAMYQYANSLLHKGEFDQALEKCKEIDQLCKKKNDNSQKFNSFIFELDKLYTHIYMEQNNVLLAQPYLNGIVEKYEKDFESNQTLSSLINYANAKLNQVLLWDKMAVDDTMHMALLLSEENYDYKAEKQLCDIYTLCYNYKEKNEEKSLLMWRIRQSHEIIRTKGLGYLATPKIMKLVKHYKSLFNDALQADKMGKRDEYIKKCKLLVNALQKTHFVGIYFEIEWYANILYILGRYHWLNGLIEESEKYYDEAVQLRCELEEDGINQNKDFFANLLYYYAHVYLNKPASQESITRSMNIFFKSEELFHEIEESLSMESLENYARCCFNLGQILCLYTDGGRKKGLSFIESAISIMERLVHNYGQSRLERDLDQFRNQYIALKKRNC